MISEIVQAEIAALSGEVDAGLSGKRVLITGGAGFLGSWLSDVLHASGARITCLDNLATGRTENIRHLLERPGFHFIEHPVETYRPETDVDVILHLASRASPDEYQLHPIETLLSNSLGTQRMLELAKRSNATLLFTSTSEVYGDAEVIPTPEDYWGNVNPIGVRSCYDEGKRFSEALMFAYHRTYGLDTRIVRIFNTYGPRLRGEGVYGRVVARFLLKALAGEAIPVYGDGSQTRSFCYVTDTIRGILKTVGTAEARGQVINLGAPREMTILDLAKTVKEVTASESPITFHPLPEDDPRRRSPNIEKAWRLLRWRPSVGIEEGLTRTVRWLSAQVPPRGQR
jgi:UDP-glucuronate decarboxylase